MKIPKRTEKAVNRRTCNTTAKRQNDKKTNNDLQNTTQKTKDRVTRPLSKLGVYLGAPAGLVVPALLVTFVVLPQLQTWGSVMNGGKGREEKIEQHELHQNP